MSIFGKDLIESAREAVAIAEGTAVPAKTLVVESVDVASIRKRLHLSQDKFADRFGLSVATVRDWEQKRRQPDRIAVNLLKVIDMAPETVERAIKAG